MKKFEISVLTASQNLIFSISRYIHQLKLVHIQIAHKKRPLNVSKLIWLVSKVSHLGHKNVKNIARRSIFTVDFERSRNQAMHAV